MDLLLDIGLQGGDFGYGTAYPTVAVGATGIFDATNTGTRLAVVIDEAIRLNMVPIVSLFSGMQLAPVFGSPSNSSDGARIITNAINSFTDTDTY